LIWRSQSISMASPRGTGANRLRTLKPVPFCCAIPGRAACRHGCSKRLCLARDDICQPLDHRAGHHWHGLEWSPFLRTIERQGADVCRSDRCVPWSSAVAMAAGAAGSASAWVRSRYRYYVSHAFLQQAPLQRTAPHRDRLRPTEGLPAYRHPLRQAGLCLHRCRSRLVDLMSPDPSSINFLCPLILFTHRSRSRISAAPSITAPFFRTFSPSKMRSPFSLSDRRNSAHRR
jgi:hypothetical protein